MASITTRTGKGSPLTNTEVDNNFTNLNTELGQKEVAANKGVAGGYASLDGSGKVPSTQLPSYVDDVVEGANLAAFPGSGETGKIYVALDTNKTYRWSGSAYVEISASPGSTDAVTEGSTNLYFTNARARSAVSATGSLSYNSSTGMFSYTQPTNVSTFTNDSGYLTGITGAQVTTALGYTPANSTSLSSYLPLSGGTLTGKIGWGTSMPNQKRIIGIYESGNLFTGIGMDASNAGVRIAGDGGAGTLLDVGQYSTDGNYNWTSRLLVSTSYASFNGSTILHAGNYTSYSPSLTGSGASGAWGISITGTSRGVGTSDPFIGTGGLWVTTGTGLNVARNSTAYVVLDAGNYSSYALPLSGGALNGATINGQTHYQWEGATYRNPGDWTATLIARRDNSSTGINGHIPALVIYNNNGGDQTTAGISFATAEGATGAGNSVALAGIVAKKESSGNVGGWSAGSLNFYVKNFGSRVDAMTIGSGGSVNILNSLTLPNSTTAVTLASGYYIGMGDWGLRNTTPYGWIQLGPANSSWCHIYGSQAFYFNQELYVNNQQVLHSGNYSSYALPLSGGTVSGSVTATSDLVARGIVRVQNGTADWDSIDLDANGATHIINSRGAETGLSFQFDGTERLFLASSGGLTTTGVIGSTAWGASTGNGTTRWVSPKGGAASWDGSQTGAIKIRLPFRANDSMWRMKVYIYNYSGNTMWEYHIGNYAYSAGGYNSAASCICTGNASPLTVRWGNDGSYDCVWIGETNSGWSYLQVAVAEFSVGFRSATSTANQDAWDISYVTSFGTVATSYTPAVNLASGSGVAGNAILHAGNYTSYAPSLGGSGATGTWGISVTGTAGSISGYNNPTTAATGNTIVYRDGNADIFGRYIFSVHFNQSSGNSENPGVSQVMVTNGSDNYLRKASIGHFTSYVQSNASGTWGITASSANKTNANSGYARVGYGMAPFYNWGGTNGGSSAPSDSTYTTGIDVGSHPSDQAYGFQIASNMWNVGLWTRTYNSGFSGWVRLLDSSNYTSYAPSLTGSGASGTWGINISGSAASLQGYTWNQAGKDVRGSQIYVDNWFRNYNSGTGLYNEATANHFYSDGQYWNVAYSGTTGIRLRNGHAGTVLGYLYGETSGRFGLLNSAGSWSISLNPDDHRHVLFGGGYDDNAYNTRDGIRLLLGGGNSDARNNYYIGTNFNDYGGYYTKLDLAWHTGIRIGAQAGYGGVRFYSDEDFSSVVFSVNTGDSHVRVTNNLYVGGNLALHAGNFTNYVPYGYPGWPGYPGTDANSYYGGNWLRSSFTYSNNAPLTGTIVSFPSSGYDIQLNGNYNGHAFSMRSRNGDNGTWMSWKRLVTDQNYGDYAVPLSGGSMSGRLTISPGWTTTGRNYSNEWIEFANHSGLYSPLNGAHFYPNNASYGPWRVAGSRNGWSGIEFDSSNGQTNLMVNPDSNTSGFHNNSYGWQWRWNAGTIYCNKNNYGGGTQATVLDSSNYTNYTIPLGGGWYGSGLPGSRWLGASVNGGEFVLGNGLPNAGQIGILIDGCYVAGENNGFWSMASDNTWGSRRGMYWDGTYLNFTTNSATTRHSAVYSDGNVTAYSDERVKTNWREVQENFVARLAAVKSGIFDRTDIELTQAGVSAQSIREVLPEVVIESNEGTLSVAYGNAAMVSAVELAKELVQLKRELAELKSKLH